MVRLNATSVHVYWNRLSLPDSDTESYTVVYSPVSETQGQEREMVAVFPGSASSAIITDLEEDLSYQLQVFATVRVDGEPLEGERGQPLLAQSEDSHHTHCLFPRHVVTKLEPRKACQSGDPWLLLNLFTSALLGRRNPGVGSTSGPS